VRDYSLFRHPRGFSQESSPSPKDWKLAPWLLGIGLSPILFGAVNSLEQAIIGTLFGVSLLFLIFELRGNGLQQRTVSFGWGVLFCLGIVIPLIPLPVELIQILSPERVRLARQFPAVSGELPGYLTLTISPAATLRRVWEISLLIACFCLARYAGRKRVDRALSLTLCASLLILSASDIWYRVWGHRKLLGIWPDSANHAAGTFANRNHFADWIYVASLFLLGWLFGKCSFESQSESPKKTRFSIGFEIVLCASAVSLPLFMAVYSGSRAGLAAGLVGFVVAALLLKSRTHSKELRLSFVFVTIGVSLIFISGSSYILNRLASEGGISFKASIWRDALRIAQRFPVTGTGLGTFERAFSHYKTFAPQSSFLYAENDCIQSFVESGFILGTLFYSLIAISFWNLYRFARTAGESFGEIMCGGLAALSAFFVHSLFEFVFQITATALLAAALFGYLHGMRDCKTSPMLLPPISKFRVIGNLGFALGLLAVSGIQILAWYRFHDGTISKSEDKIAASLRVWPAATDRIFAYIPLAQGEFVRNVTMPRSARPSVDRPVERAINLDPLNWRLRYEAFPLRAREFPAGAADEAWRIVRLNPLQPALPLFFAQEFIKRSPEQAVPFLNAAARFSENLNPVLDLAWKLDPSPASLWRVIPASDSALQALGDFALRKSLPGMASTAFQRLSEKVPAERRAANFIEAGRADLALKILSGNSAQANLQRGRAYLQLGQVSEALQAAELVLSQKDFEGQMARSDTQISSNSQRGALLAKAAQIMRYPARQRDRAQLRQLAETSGIPRISWMLLQTERELGLQDSAAATALRLAGEL
jgi:hypothetical protein